MPFNGSGVFQRVRNWVADATAGIKIKADYHDAEDDNFAAGITNCIARDGQSIITQNIPFNAKRATGLEDPVNDQDAATKKYTDTKAVAGGTFTGDITIDKDNPTLILDKNASGQSSAIWGKMAGKSRWLMRLGNDQPETGSNTGSDFDLHRYADDGSYIGQVLYFWRNTGLGTVAGDPTATMGISTKQYTDTRVIRSGDTMTGQLTTAPGADLGSGGGVGTIEVRGSGAFSAMSFHIPSTFAANFGLRNDGNFWMGGWSHGAGVAYRFWTTRDFGALPTLPANVVVNGRLAFAGDLAAATGPQSSPYEPYAGAVITGWQWAIVSTAHVTAFRLRYMQLYSTSWYTVGYA